MKLTPEQQLEKKARENIKRLINRVSSEYSFKKWRNLHSYLRSIGADIVGQDRELTRAEVDELLRQYEENAFRSLQKSSVLSSVERVSSGDKSLSEGDKLSKDCDKAIEVATQAEEKFTEKNNYGLSKSEKENVTLFWFQKKAATELLKGFNV